MPRKYYKHALLLDEGVEPRTFFPTLNNLFNVKHITQDYKFVGLPDKEICDFAVKEERIVITYNVKDFKPLAEKSKRTGVIGLSSNLSTVKIDKKLTAPLRKATKKELCGRYTPLSEAQKVAKIN